LVFLVQGFPRVGFVEPKMEEVSIGLAQGGSPLWPGSGRAGEWLERGGQGEHRRPPVHEASLRENRGLWW
jgi:hypothetical protein